MRKSIIAATLAMTVGVAGAQAGGGYADNTQYVAPTTTAAPTSGSVVLTDVPAGHWARDAVEAIVKAGLIQGFPDGTFRGNENLTRYQAAMIFHRLLQSGALSGSDISDEDLLVITRGMQEVSTELAAISSRLTDVERLTVEQQARIDAIEAAIEDMDTGDTSALVARIDALEARIAQLEGAAVTVPTSPAPVVETPTTGTDIVIGTPDTVVTPTTGNMYAGIGAGYYPKSGQLGNTTDYDCISPLHSARQVADPATGVTNQNLVPWCGSVLGTVGTTNVYGPVGARVNVEYIPGRDNAVAADVNATVGTDLGLVQPYAGAGVGVVLGKDRPATLGTQNSATDIYANLLGGADFKVTPNVGLFAEANGKYYFSSNTTVAQGATGNTGDIYDNATSNNTGGLGFGARAGVKLFF
ncbi:S-layer domain-containing protein [Deinococcus proteolyticus MRP]|uniref:S-layer domain-containing protein n=1 Tax=Deinococcus proteolyticus (strain ATCC 35074 / DSM 20540 / JCM 6276 / NBRC 101906 / NCIMB 13154 / VKM Ac-1939 / CCM 2703 / MRP) TaxID=693977 RepID=F0RMJ4_DEIPM|nr:S-layer homology domain-containing protein [Deinococcus proteolyticus]ADY26044.1 S-layer domain-containing protein [Deinococcus proteolyticus MRP]